MGSGRKVFNSVFESAFKMGKTAYFFFLDSLKFFSEPERFLSKFRQKESGCFLKEAKYVRRRLLRYVFQFFSFLSFEQESSKLWAELHRRNSQFSFFCVEKTFGTSFPKTLRFLDCEIKNLSRWPKTFLQCFWKWIQHVQKKRSSCFFTQKSIIFLGSRTKVSRSLKWKKLAPTSKKVQVACAKEQLGNDSKWNVSLMFYSSRKFPDYGQNFSDKI